MNENIITVQLNGIEKKIKSSCPLTEALKLWGHDNSFCALAINQTHIPRSHYQTTILNNHDSIEILTPMQGG